MWWCLVILRGPGVVVFNHPEGMWCLVRGGGGGGGGWCGVWSS